MLTVHQTPSITLTTKCSRDIEADLLILPVFEDDPLTDEPDLDSASGGELSAALARREVTGKAYDLFFTAVRGWKSPRVLLVGAGPRGEFTADRLRRTAIAGGLAARDRGMTRVALIHRGGTSVTPEQAAQVLAEGAVLSNFDGASYKTSDTTARVADRGAGARRRVGQAASPAVDAALERGRVLGECTNLARTLSNEPSNTLTPRVFAERAQALAKDAGLSVGDPRREAHCRTEDGPAARRRARQRRAAARRHPAPRAEEAPSKGPVLGLIGKGITFDTGGISIKPADNMDKMKDDMSGGAAVLCAMAAISRLQAPVRCIGVIPLTENMPGGSAIKPGDVLTSAEGKTVEVLNTDAEGRLILGDAVWYARQLGATHLVDVATLTGACVVALGKYASGLFGTPDAWRRSRAGRRASAPATARGRCRSSTTTSSCSRARLPTSPTPAAGAGGAITGALFIKQFTGDLPWVHIDIAGTAWAEDAKPYQPKGATGVGVRTLAELALDAEAWGSKL